MSVCIPFTHGVPGQDAPPRWWDTSQPPDATTPFNSDYLDYRWEGAYSQSYGTGTTPVTTFRALYRPHPTKANGAYLFFSWIVWHDLDPIDVAHDAVYVGFKCASEDLIVRVILSNDNTDKNAQTAYQIDFYSRNTDGSLSPLPKPNWLKDQTVAPTASDQGTVRVWQVTKNPTDSYWVISMRVPAFPGATHDEGVDLTPSSFKMWYYYEIFTDAFSSPDPTHPSAGLVKLAWPEGKVPTISADTGSQVFPGPTDWESYSLGTVTASVLTPSCASGVGISFGYYDVGTTDPISSSNLKFAPQISSDPPVAQPLNTFFIKPTNQTGHEVKAGDLRASIRLANWGSCCGADGFQDAPIVTLNAAGTNTNELNDLPFSSGEVKQIFTLGWRPSFQWAVNMTAQPGQTYPAKTRHQCMLIELFSNKFTGGGPDDPDSIQFINSSIYRNMDFVPASTYSRDAEISVVGLEPFSVEGRDVYLSVETRQMSSKQSEPGIAAHLGEMTAVGHAKSSEELAAAYVKAVQSGQLDGSRIDQILPTVRVHCYHDTGEREIRNGRTYVVLGLQSSFGFFAVHAGALEGWRFAIAGAKRIAENLYVVRAPNHGAARITTTLQAVEPGENPLPLDPIVPHVPQEPSDGDFLDRLLLLIDRILALLDKLDGCASRIDPVHALLRRVARVIRALPLPADARDSLLELLDGLGGLRDRLSLLAAMHHVLEAIEHHLQALDRIFDQLRAVGRARRDALLQKLFGAEADRIRKQLNAVEAQVWALGGLFDTLNKLVDLLSRAADGCKDMDALHVALRGLARSIDKLAALGAGLEKRFPFLDKLIPTADAKGGALAKQLDLVHQSAAQLDEIAKILDGLPEHLTALQKAAKELDAIDYHELSRVADQLHKAAFG
ncbi:Hypothetical protein A7982_02243 [Minicystis rosea]|nr:Hypothetical protein A7982_02243 [Minicystis rosea]